MAVYLLNYESGMATGKSSVNYTLYLIEIKFFGLYRRKFTKTYELTAYHSYNNTFEKWDCLIKDKININYLL